MKVFRENLLFQFSVASFVVLSLMAVFLSFFLVRAINELMIHREVHEVVETLSPRVVSALRPEDLAQPMVGERYRTFDRFVRDSVLSATTARIKIWNKQGQIIYSDDERQVGQTFPIHEELAAALAGVIGQELSVPTGAESIQERHLGTLLKIHAPIRFSGSTEVIGSVEIYHLYTHYAEHISSIQKLTYGAIASGFFILYLALGFIVAGGWRMILRQRKTLENRLMEVNALNKLLQSHLARRQQAIQDLHKLCEEIEARQANLHPEEAAQFHNVLATRLHELAAEFEYPPFESS